jgi:endonuclease-3
MQTYLNNSGFFAILPKLYIMRKEERYRRVLDYFQTNHPVAETELAYSDPYELTVAVILSAQCTDKRVNLITPPFYRMFPDFYTLSVADPAEVLKLVGSCSYPNNKTKNLIAMAKVVAENFRGILPGDVDELQTIPGIGRKTANVLASVLFNQPALAVDTHVFRVAARIGLTTNARNPLQAEQQLVRHIPENLRGIAHHWLILHGRYICKARKPQCSSCGLRDICRFFQAGKAGKSPGNVNN